MRTTTGLLCVLVLGGWAGAADDAWVEPMKTVHARFTGQAGTVAQFGGAAASDEGFFAPLRSPVKDLPAELKPAREWLVTWVRGRCWTAWKAPEFGCKAGATAAWAAGGIAGWLKRMNPEVALILLGGEEPAAAPGFARDLRAVVAKCLEKGTVPIVCAPPGVKAKALATAVAELAGKMKVPLVAPADPAALNRLTLKTLHRLHQQVFSKVKSAHDSLYDAYWAGPKHKGRPAVLVRKYTLKPVVDGSLLEPCWKLPRTLPFFLIDGDVREPAHKTQAKIYSDSTNIYLVIRCSEPDPGKIVSKKRNRDDGGILQDDHVGVFLAVPASPPERYYHIAVNPDGSYLTALGRDAKAWDPRIQVGATRSTTVRKLGPGCWAVEIVLPFVEMKLPADVSALSGPWRLNLTRTRRGQGKGPVEQVALSPTDAYTPHVPSLFAYAWFQALGGKLPPEDVR